MPPWCCMDQRQSQKRPPRAAVQYMHPPHCVRLTRDGAVVVGAPVALVHPWCDRVAGGRANHKVLRTRALAHRWKRKASPHRSRKRLGWCEHWATVRGCTGVRQGSQTGLTARGWWPIRPTRQRQARARTLPCANALTHQPGRCGTTPEGPACCRCPPAQTLRRCRSDGSTPTSLSRRGAESGRGTQARHLPPPPPAPRRAGGPSAAGRVGGGRTRWVRRGALPRRRPPRATTALRVACDNRRDPGRTAPRARSRYTRAFAVRRRTRSHGVTHVNEYHCA
jgi:hypothetical protein